MTFQALSLDFGGTLATEVRSRAALYAEAAAAHGKHVEEGRMAELMARVHADLPLEVERGYRYSDPWFEAFLGRIFHDELGLGGEALESVGERLFAQFSDARTFRVFPGVRELLAAAKRAGLRLAVVSNWSPRLELLLGRLGLLDAFDEVLASASERLEKPAPELFLRAVQRLGVEPADALHAGDRLDNDVEAARAAGLGSVLVDHSGTMRGRAFPANVPADVPVVGSFAQLAHHLGIE